MRFSSVFLSACLSSCGLTSIVLAQKWTRHAVDPAGGDLRGADGVRVGDANGDGLPDLVTGWEEGNAIRVYLNPGPKESRSPWPAVTVGRVRSAEDAVFADLDGDGNLDVVSCTEGWSKTVFVHWAPKSADDYLKSAAWETQAIPCTESQQQWMFALPMDVDGENGIDLVIGSKGKNGSVGWLQSPARPRELRRWKFKKIVDAGWIMSLRSTGKGFDLASVFVTDRKGEARGVYRLLPERSGTSVLWKRHDLGGRGRVVMFLDLWPGTLWPLVATRNGEILDYSTLDVARPQSSKLRRIPNPFGVKMGKAVRIGDLDLDGDLDIVHTANTDRNRPGVTWIENQGGRWRRVHDVSGVAGSKFDRIELLDLDADGDLDVVTCEENAGANSQGLGVIWYENPTRSSSSAASREASRRTRPQKFFDWTRLTFAKEEYVARRAKLVESLKAAGSDILLVPSGEGTSHGSTFRQLDDFLYLTGLELPSSVLALDSKTLKVTLFAPAADRRFHNVARRNDFPGRRLVGDPELPKRTGLVDVRVFSEFDKALAKWVEDGRGIAVASGRISALPPLDDGPFPRGTPVDGLRRYLGRKYPALTVRNATSHLALLRMVKSPAEIDVLRRACAITVAGIRRAASTIRPGVDERSLEGVLEGEFKKLGAQRPAFASIIKSGPNSLWPWRILAAHYDRRNRKMQAGELVIFDVGCELDHYASDVGRTFPVSGEFSARQRKILEMETAVADAVIAAVKPGVTLRELQEVANAKIPREHRRYMQTGLFFGHHIGLAVGDPSFAGARLLPGMVFTVEP